MKEEIENIIKKHQSNFGEILDFDLLIDDLLKKYKIDMIEFSWWLTENLGNYNDDKQAHFNSEYLKHWLKYYRNDNTN